MVDQFQQTIEFGSGQIHLDRDGRPANYFERRSVSQQINISPAHIA
jgi:hypothetical protein